MMGISSLDISEMDACAVQPTGKLFPVGCSIGLNSQNKRAWPGAADLAEKASNYTDRERKLGWLLAACDVMFQIEAKPVCWVIFDHQHFRQQKRK